MAEETRSVSRVASRLLASVAFLCLGFVTLAPSAVAQDGADTDDQIFLTGRLVVPQGEEAKTAILFSGDAVIDGVVAGWLVVFNGRTVITGSVEEDVVVFAGDVVLRSGSRVGGDVISLEDPQIEEGATVGGSVEDLETSWNLYDITFGGRFAWWLAYSVSTLVLGLVLLLFAVRLDRASVRALRDRLGASIGFGFLVLALLPVVAGLLFGDDRRDPARFVPALRAGARVLDWLRGLRAGPRPARRQGA